VRQARCWRASRRALARSWPRRKPMSPRSSRWSIDCTRQPAEEIAQAYANVQAAPPMR